MNLPNIILSSILLLAVNGNLLSQHNLKHAVNDFSAAPEFKHASISFLAINAENNEIIGELNPELSLASASTIKLFSTAAALEILGPT